MAKIEIYKSFPGVQIWIDIDTCELIFDVKNTCLKQLKYYQATTLKDPWWDFQEERWIENPWTTNPWTTKPGSEPEDIPF